MRGEALLVAGARTPLGIVSIGAVRKLLARVGC